MINPRIAPIPASRPSTQTSNATSASPESNFSILSQSSPGQSTKLSQYGAVNAKEGELRAKLAFQKEATHAQFKDLKANIKKMASTSGVNVTELDKSSPDTALRSMKMQIEQIENDANTKEPGSVDTKQLADLRNQYKKAGAMLEDLKTLKNEHDSVKQEIQELENKPHESNSEGDFMQQQMAFQSQMMQRQQELSSLNQKTALISEQIKAAEAQVMAMINSMLAGVEELTAINKKGNQIATGAI